MALRLPLQVRCTEQTTFGMRLQKATLHQGTHMDNIS